MTDGLYRIFKSDLVGELFQHLSSGINWVVDRVWIDFVSAAVAVFMPKTPDRLWKKLLVVIALTIGMHGVKSGVHQLGTKYNTPVSVDGDFEERRQQEIFRREARVPGSVL